MVDFNNTQSLRDSNHNFPAQPLSSQVNSRADTTSKLQPPTHNVSMEEALEQGRLSIRIQRQTPHSQVLTHEHTTDLDSVPFCFTKGGDSYITAVVCKDTESEVAFDTYLQGLGLNKEKLLLLYGDFDPALEIISYPSNHYPLRILAADQQSLDILKWQVFSCPCFNVLSFELRDTREGINSQINLPLSYELFDDETTCSIDAIMRVPERRAGLEFGHAVLHELGHYSAPVPIAPKLRDGLHLSGFSLDFAGELATDALAGCILGPSAPEMSLYTFLVRSPGHWAKRGFSDDAPNAWVNSDNDSLVSAFCWGFFCDRNIITPGKNGKWHVDTERIFEGFQEILGELGTAIARGTDESSQNDAVLDWARQYVPYNDNGFELQTELKQAFSRTSHLPDVPVITPRMGQLDTDYNLSTSTLLPIGDAN